VNKAYRHSPCTFQPTVLFSQTKPATNNQPAVFFSQNKPAPAAGQTNRLIAAAPAEQYDVIKEAFTVEKLCSALRYTTTLAVRCWAPPANNQPSSPSASFYINFD
jgi:hypothetical protein